MTAVACVVPSCRRDSLDQFLEAWYPFPWNRTYIVWDGRERPDLGKNVVILNWQDMQAVEEKVRQSLFSRRDSAIRCFGFVRAVRDGADVVVTIDDDCRPEPGMARMFVEQHLINLRRVPAFTSSIPGMPVRGMPRRMVEREMKVGVSMGLWANHADMDSLHSILSTPGTQPGFQPPRGVRLMSSEQLFPLCGMNLAFRKELLPAMYFPKMGMDSRYSRFDDIWAGLVAQRAAAGVGYRVVVGDPIVDHQRASQPFDNLRREVPGLLLNEWLWEAFQDMGTSVVGASTVADSVMKIADWLMSVRDRSPDPDYLRDWSSYLRTWVSLCQLPD